MDSEVLDLVGTHWLDDWLNRQFDDGFLQQQFAKGQYCTSHHHGVSIADVATRVGLTTAAAVAVSRSSAVVTPVMSPRNFCNGSGLRSVRALEDELLRTIESKSLLERSGPRGATKATRSGQTSANFRDIDNRRLYPGNGSCCYVRKTGGPSTVCNSGHKSFAMEQRLVRRTNDRPISCMQKASQSVARGNQSTVLCGIYIERSKVRLQAALAASDYVRRCKVADWSLNSVLLTRQRRLALKERLSN